jgi:hypothetical protein
MIVAGMRLQLVVLVRARYPAFSVALSWRNRNFVPHELTELKVTVAPAGEATTVAVTHLRWSASREDHPVLHRYKGGAVNRMTEMWWINQLCA